MTLRPRTLPVALTLLLLPLAACDDAAPPPESPAPPAVTFRTAEVVLITESDTLPMPVEVADEPSQHAMGLMERTSLPDSAGMLFVFPETRPADAGFWMFRTRIPLDIAFLDEGGTIVNVQSMEPCTSPEPRWCPTYAPGVPYRSALEANVGFFERVGVGVGDRVLAANAPMLRADSSARPVPH